MTTPTPRPELSFGPDALDALAQTLRDRGCKRVLLLTGPSRRFEGRVRAALEGLEIVVFDGAKVHVPAGVVRRAEQAARTAQPDALVSLGGGAATGLAKALRLGLDVPFFAVPTTFAGSEATSIYGVTDGDDKRTGRDERARPDAVFYVPDFLLGLPRANKITSLLNALAHPISALGAGPLDTPLRREALDAIERLVGAALQLAETPERLDSHTDGLRGAARAGRVLDGATLGVHHQIAHRLGGRFGLEHAALHAALLPHSVAALRAEQPEVYAAIERAAGVPDLPAQLFDLLERVGAKAALADLGVPMSALEEALADREELPRACIEAAWYGRRPSAGVTHADLGLRAPVAVGGAPLEAARTVVIAVHGRDRAAESAIAEVWRAAGHVPGLAVLAPQAPGRAWYTPGYREPAETLGAPLARAFDELDALLAHAQREAPRARRVLFGFSQGACVAIEHVARRAPDVDALIALGGARVGPRDGYPAALRRLEGLPVVLGLAEQDPWVDLADAEATAAWFAEAGATVCDLPEPGDRHEISARQRLAAGPLLRGDPARGPERGFGNHHELEALPGALPPRQNSPRRVKYGLYAEQINGTGFVADRQDNLRSWLYRVRPSAQHSPFARLEHPTFGQDLEPGVDPNLAGWDPLELPEDPTDFVDGLATFGGAGSPALRRGFAIHLYVANRSMEHRALYDSDGDLLIIPQLGAITLRTELGPLLVPPGKIAIVPRGIKFSVLLEEGPARGYVAEVYGRHFELPPRGPVGANGLTDARHFEVPRPDYEDTIDPGFRLVSKLGGALFEATQDYSPFDVVAWHGNYTPYVYDLMDFGPVGNVRFDHPDPSIYTVLTAPMDEVGAHSLDFVFFPPRWDVTEDTFRPPFFHRNATTEFNGIIRMPGGRSSIFSAGGYFVTPSMTAHGVMDKAVERTFLATEPDPAQRTTEASMWFQFETALPIQLTGWAKASPNRVPDWPDRWGTYRTHFDPEEV